MMTINEINKLIRQRPPFQMIERVLELEENVYARGIKCVSVNEPHFQGHFPDAPIMPGVLIVEACAQLCSLVIENKGIDESKLYVLLKVDNFKFIKPVIPGDVLDITVKKVNDIGPLTQFDAIVKVSDQIFVKGSMTFTAVDKESIYNR